jgi:hypothetical protein
MAVPVPKWQAIISQREDQDVMPVVLLHLSKFDALI